MTGACDPDIEILSKESARNLAFLDETKNTKK